MSFAFQANNKLTAVARIVGGKYNGKTRSLNPKIKDIDSFRGQYHSLNLKKNESCFK